MNIISSHTFKHALRDIHKNTENRKFCFVIGAGASVSSGIPTGGKLAKDWFDEIKERYSKKEINDWITEQGIDQNDLAAHYGSIYRKRFEADKTSGYEFLVQAMRTAKPSVGHIILGQILSRVPGHCVLTTNFDSLVETSIYQFTDKTPLVCGHESLSGYARPSHIHPLIIKIHRDLLLDPKSDPDEINKLDSGWNEPLDNIFSTHIPIVIGYGGNDGSLMSYFEQMKKPSNFFWCGLDAENQSERVTLLINKIGGQYIQIEGFDQLMHELLWVFDEIKPIREELNEITKSRIETATSQLNKLTDKKFETGKTRSGHTQESKHHALINEEDISSELSALEYANLAQIETNTKFKTEIYEEALINYPDTAWLWIDYISFLNSEKVDSSIIDSCFTKALEFSPDNTALNMSYAVFLSEQKSDFNIVEHYFLKALSLIPDNTEAILIYAHFLYSQKRDYENAEKYLLKALSISPHALNALFYYAVFLLHIKNDYSTAEQYLLEALLRNPDHANILASYAQLLLILNRKSEATIYLKKAFKLNYPERQDTLIELWFYRYAHYDEFIEEAEKKVEALLSEGIKSIGWSFDHNIRIAIENGHPNPEKLRDLAKRITTK